MSERRIEFPKGRRTRDVAWRISPAENWYRDVVLLLVTIFVVIAVVKSHEAVTQQRHDRGVTAGAICGAVNAVIEAGRATITGGQKGISGKFERNLRKLGFPPRQVRLQQAKKAADLYAKNISSNVAENTNGVVIKGLVKKDGTLNCGHLPLLRKDSKR